MSYSKDYSKCAKCGSVKDINCIWYDGEYFSICYDCLVELLKKETDLQIEEVDGETIFVSSMCEDLEVREKDLTSYMGMINSFDNYFGDIGIDDTLCWDCNGSAKKMFIIYDEKEKEDVTICPTCLAERVGLKAIWFDDNRQKERMTGYDVFHNDKLIATERDITCFEDWLRYNDDIINYCINNLGLKVEQLPIEYTDNMKLIYEGKYIPPIFFKVIG